MSLNNKQQREMIAKYHQGLLSDQEMHQIEMDASEDAFLEEALEGYSQLKGDQELVQLESKIRARIDNQRTSHFSQSFILPMIILSGIFMVLNHASVKPNHQGTTEHAIIKNNSTGAPNQATTIDHQTDITAVIKKAKKIPEKEWIQISPKTTTLQTTTPKSNEVKKIDSTSTIQVNVIPETTIEKNIKVVLHPIYYLYDLKVASYKGYRTGSIEDSDLNHSIAAMYENQQSEQNNLTVNKKILYEEYLSLCMQFFSQGDIKEALSGFQTILHSYPDDANALFYGGISSYNLGMTSHAIALLTQSSNHPFGVFDQESEWFLILAYLKNKDTEKAKLLLEKIANDDHFYKQKAIDKLSEMAK